MGADLLFFSLSTGHSRILQRCQRFPFLNYHKLLEILLLVGVGCHFAFPMLSCYATASQIFSYF